MKEKICIILIAVFVALFGTSTYFIYDYYRQASEQEALYESLIETVEQVDNTEETEPINRYAVGHYEILGYGVPQY